MKDPNVDNGMEGNGPEGSTASSLLERAREHAPGAWERLTSLYCPLIYGWSRRAGLKPEDAADVVQEVFRTVVTHLSGFRRERSGDTFRGWLWTITQNKVRDWRRGKAGRPEAAGGTGAQQALLQVPDAQSSGTSDSSCRRPDPLLACALELIRSEFKDRSWQAFWGVVVEGRCSADVAAALGISTNAVYVARSRILRRLREELGDPSPGSEEGRNEP